MLQARRPGKEEDRAPFPALRPGLRLARCTMPMWLPDAGETGAELRCTLLAGHPQPHVAHASSTNRVIAVAYERPTLRAVNQACQELHKVMEDLRE